MKFTYLLSTLSLLGGIVIGYYLLPSSTQTAEPAVLADLSQAPKTDSSVSLSGEGSPVVNKLEQAGAVNIPGPGAVFNQFLDPQYQENLAKNPALQALLLPYALELDHQVGVEALANSRTGFFDYYYYASTALVKSIALNQGWELNGKDYRIFYNSLGSIKNFISARPYLDLYQDVELGTAEGEEDTNFSRIFSKYAEQYHYVERPPFYVTLPQAKGNDKEALQQRADYEREQFIALLRSYAATYQELYQNQQDLAVLLTSAVNAFNRLADMLAQGADNYLKLLPETMSASDKDLAYYQYYYNLREILSDYLTFDSYSYSYAKEEGKDFPSSDTAYKLQSKALLSLQRLYQTLPLQAYQGIANNLSQFKNTLKANKWHEQYLKSLENVKGKTISPPDSLYDNGYPSYSEAFAQYHRTLVGFFERVLNDPDNNFAVPLFATGLTELYYYSANPYLEQDLSSNYPNYKYLILPALAKANYTVKMDGDSLDNRLEAFSALNRFLEELKNNLLAKYQGPDYGLYNRHLETALAKIKGALTHLAFKEKTCGLPDSKENQCLANVVTLLRNNLAYYPFYAISDHMFKHLEDLGYTSDIYREFVLYYASVDSFKENINFFQGDLNSDLKLPSLP